MKLIVFSKLFKDKSLDELIEMALRYGFEGYDLCVRPGYVVNPDNAADKLPEAVAQMRRSGLDVPMITGNFDLLLPDHATAEPILAAMDAADVRRIKLGYFKFDPHTQDYWQEVSNIRSALAGWQTLGQQYNVKICYHTHSKRCMGLNAAALMHLLNGFDPQVIGAYLDPGHMVIEGEEFSFGLAMAQRYLSIISLKDVLKIRVEVNGHGRYRVEWVPAGAGLVDWTTVFADLHRVQFDGPLSIHCEFEVPPAEFDDTLRREVAFFKQSRKLYAS